MEFSERIVEVRNQKNLSQKAFADDLGVSQKTVSYWEQGRNEPQISVIRTICNKYNVSLPWLVFGIGDIFVEDQFIHLSHLPKESADDVELHYFPEVMAAAAPIDMSGFISDSEEIQVLRASKGLLRQMGIYSYRGLEIIRAVGDSMLPTITPGDWLIIQRVEDIDDIPREGAMCVIHYDDGIMVKRLEVHKKHRIVYLHSDNKAYDKRTVGPEEIEAGEFRLIGRVLTHFNEVH